MPAAAPGPEAASLRFSPPRMRAGAGRRCPASPVRQRGRVWPRSEPCGGRGGAGAGPGGEGKAPCSGSAGAASPQRLPQTPSVPFLPVCRRFTVPAGAEVSQDAGTRAASASHSLLLESQRPASSLRLGLWRPLLTP